MVGVPSDDGVSGSEYAVGTLGLSGRGRDYSGRGVCGVYEEELSSSRGVP